MYGMSFPKTWVPQGLKIHYTHYLFPLYASEVAEGQVLFLLIFVDSC